MAKGYHGIETLYQTISKTRPLVVAVSACCQKLLELRMILETTENAIVLRKLGKKV